MQRISSGTFLVVCAIALVGCGSNGASATTTTAPVTAPALVPTESDVTVAGSSGDAAAGDEPAVVEHALGAVDVVADPARDLKVGADVKVKVHCGRAAVGYVWFHELWEFIQSRILFRL